MVDVNRVEGRIQRLEEPSDYADVFTILGQKGVVPSELAERLAGAQFASSIERLAHSEDDSTAG